MAGELDFTAGSGDFADLKLTYDPTSSGGEYLLSSPDGKKQV
jgi:hypothetical protein